jgi:hypothetical protein
MSSKANLVTFLTKLRLKTDMARNVLSFSVRRVSLEDQRWRTIFRRARGELSPRLSSASQRDEPLTSMENRRR